MRQDVIGVKKFYIYIKTMFPYNDIENNWISGIENLSLDNTVQHNNFII